MKRNLVLCLCVCLLALPAWAQDAVKVDAKHYKVVVENEYVRVLRINYGAKEKSVMHSHPNSVAVFLTDFHGQFTLPDGTKQPVDAKAGSTLWTAAASHLPENLGDKPMELILVELKAQPGAAMAAPKGSKDPLQLAGVNCTVDFENEWVRVLRWKEKAGEKNAMHGHPALVTVALTGGKAKYTAADGKSRELTSKAGDATWSAPDAHASEDLSNQPSELVQVELKVKTK
jgi:quercetin dioxygenase-like cupin family protein